MRQPAARIPTFSGKAAASRAAGSWSRHAGICAGSHRAAEWGWSGPAERPPMAPFSVPWHRGRAAGATGALVHFLRIHRRRHGFHRHVFLPGQEPFYILCFRSRDLVVHQDLPLEARLVQAPLWAGRVVLFRKRLGELRNSRVQHQTPRPPPLLEDRVDCQLRPPPPRHQQPPQVHPKVLPDCRSGQ